MALAASEPGAAMIDRDQRHQHQVGDDLGLVDRRLEQAERAGDFAGAGAEAERLGRVGETRKGDGRPAPGGGVQRAHRAQFAAQRRIAADHPGIREERPKHFRERILEHRPVGIGQCRDVRFARLERGLAQGLLGQRREG